MNIKIPNIQGMHFPYLANILFSFIVSILIVYPILGFSTNAIFSMIILFIIFFILINSITNENLSNELPNYLTPYPPRMGLDGISLGSHVAGLDTNLY